jgi:hypothetical protein
MIFSNSLIKKIKRKNSQTNSDLDKYTKITTHIFYRETEYELF